MSSYTRADGAHDVIGGGWDGSAEHKTGAIGGGFGWVWRAREQVWVGGEGVAFFRGVFSPALRWPTALARHLAV